MAFFYKCLCGPTMQHRDCDIWLKPTCNAVVHVQSSWSGGPAQAVSLLLWPCKFAVCPVKPAWHPFECPKSLSCTCRACGSAAQPARVPTEAGGYGAVCSTCSGRQGSKNGQPAPAGLGSACSCAAAGGGAAAAAAGAGQNSGAQVRKGTLVRGRGVVVYRWL